MTPEEETIKLFEQNDIDLVATLPCDRLKNLLPLIPKRFFEIPLTREEDGVGICAGAFLAGAKPLMLIQSTGVGNLLNALSSLNFTYEIPLPIVASWRGVYQEGILAQIYWGTHIKAVLNALGVSVYEVHTVRDLQLISQGIEDSFRTSVPVVVLISPELWQCALPDAVPQPQENRADFVGEFAKDKPIAPSVSPQAPRECPAMTRYEAIEAAVPYLRGRTVVCNLGVPCKELYALCDQPSNFYMLGSMGLASSIGLGVSLYAKQEVVVLDGDGSLLMNPNALCSIAQHARDNLTVIALDNGTYGSTGDQCTPSQQLDLELLARGFGIQHTTKAYTAEELLNSLHLPAGSKFIHALIKPGNANVPDLPYSAADIKRRFMAHLRGGQM
ncbi:MAG TPA: sulfopyruvate decarboxylase subunit alpha [Candidatus Bathyarchaeia archaeon]|nr:sulfopyruvate decarboxylase subunit alpha [Candidatus Bathyarchaeia archaeon]